MVSGRSARAIVIDPMHVVRSVCSIHVIAPTSKVRGRHVAITVCKKLKITKSGQFPMARRSYQDVLKLVQRLSHCNKWMDGWTDVKTGHRTNVCILFIPFLHALKRMHTTNKNVQHQNSFNGAETSINLLRPRLTFSNNAFCQRVY